MKVAKTLPELLRLRAEQQADRHAYIFLTDAGTEHAITYAELDRKARSIASLLADVASPGDRAVLLYPPGLDYICAFFGCLYAGVVAVPTYPINPGRTSQATERLRGIVADCSPQLVLTNARLLKAFEGRGEKKPDAGKAAWLATTSAEGGDGAWSGPAIAPESLAFLQYTSGSTAEPKGVMVSHANLLHNERAIRAAFENNGDSLVVGWLPWFHDMGLIGNILQPLYLGSTSVLMSPTTFLQSPIRWLQAISTYRAHISGGPNFGYELCLKKISREQTAGLDLSCWRIAFNGAEPVRHDTMERFAEAFAHCGFRRDAFFPCYGMAEATLMVSGGPPARSAVRHLERESFARHQVVSAKSAENAQTIVGCGVAVADFEIAVVDPETRKRVGVGEIGEIWAKGPSVALGYWNRPEAITEIFQASIAGTGEGPFLRTGDLGFLDEGSVFVTGRRKDLIIIRGRNYYPQDIEKSAEEAHPSCRRGCSAAFSVEEREEEGLALIQEVDAKAADQPDIICGALRRAIAERHGIQPVAIALAAPGVVLKTTSGKVRRSACRDAFLSGALNVLWCDARDRVPAGTHAEEVLTRESYLALQPEFRAPALESWLVSQASQILMRPLDASEMHRSLTALGMDSLNAADLADRIERELGARINLADLLENSTMASLSVEIARQLEDPASQREVSAAIDGPAPTEEFPLSYGQQAFWIIDKAGTRSGENNLASAVRLGEKTDLDLLRRSFGFLGNRHMSLRTVYAVLQGQPVQRFQSGGRKPTDFSVTDASSWDEDQLNRRITEEARKPFDLFKGRLFRIHIYTRQRRQPVMLLVFHHSIIDFWSVSIVVSELATVYSALVAGKEPVLPAIQGRYTDFVRWQREFVQSPEGAQAWDYWQKQLQGPLPALRLPALGEAEKTSADEQGESELFLSAELLSALKPAANARSVTISNYLLAAFAVLLQRHTSQDDIMIGVPASGRGGHSSFRNLTGYFVNSLPLRMDLSGDPLFTELVGRVQRVYLRGIRHQHFPFSLIVERLNPPRLKGRTPIFQALFVWQQAHLPGMEGLAGLTFGEHGAKWESGGLTMESAPVHGQPARFDLTLFVTETASGLHGTFKYRAGMFDGEAMAGLSNQFVNLLEEIARDANRRVSEFALLRPEEEARLVHSFGAGAVSRRELSFSELVEAQADANPDQPALVDDQVTLSYRELSEKVNAIAGRLRECGAGPEKRVAVFLPRGVRAIVSLLGILRVGAAYVPLDVRDPQSRLAEILTDAQVSAVIADSSTRDLLPRLPRNPAIIDPDMSPTDRSVAPVAYLPERLAYMIYTSGSAGTPKGVLIQNDSLLNLLKGLSQDIYSRFEGRTLRVGLNAPLFFDASVKQLVCLALGHSLHVLPEEARRNSLLMANFIERQRLDVMDCTPTQAEMLYAGGHISQANGAAFLLGGEPIGDSLWKRLAARPQPSFNVYGPTECTVDATFCRVEPKTPPSIGRPLSTTRVYILDRHLRAVPPGVSGEIFIGGTSVARGYNGRPDLTAEKFLPDTFAQEPGARMYRTGDGGRYFKDGRIECLGRLDRQLKIRGFRIEPGEIESVLISFPGVSEAAVVMRTIGDESHSLAAYVVVNGGWPEHDALRQHLHARLPEYMVPATIDVIPAMPMTPGGKRDLNALPAPQTVVDDIFVGGDLPGSPIEIALASMWRKGLRVEKVGIHDDFFALGGHSLMATRMAALLEEIFEPDMPLLALFFQDPTVAGLASLLSETTTGRTRMNEAVLMLERVDFSAVPSETESAACDR